MKSKTWKTVDQLSSEVALRTEDHHSWTAKVKQAQKYSAGKRSSRSWNSGSAKSKLPIRGLKTIWDWNCRWLQGKNKTWTVSWASGRINASRGSELWSKSSPSFARTKTRGRQSRKPVRSWWTRSSSCGNGRVWVWRTRLTDIMACLLTIILILINLLTKMQREFRSYTRKENRRVSEASSRAGSKMMSRSKNNS